MHHYFCLGKNTHTLFSSGTLLLLSIDILSSLQIFFPFPPLHSFYLIEWIVLVGLTTQSKKKLHCTYVLVIIEETVVVVFSIT